MSHKPSLKSNTAAILVMFVLLNAACDTEVVAPDTPTPTPLVVITNTLPPTQTPRPSATPVPPTATMPFEPIEGQTSSQLNVRIGPSADSDLLGTIPIFDKVQIVGKDPTGAWWLIVYPGGPNGTGWITAQYVLVTSGGDRVPVINQAAQGGGNLTTTADPSQTGAGPTIQPGSVSAPSQIPPASNQSLASAFEDGDSSQSPAVSVALAKSSMRTFNYSSDISGPAGDSEDWVQFRLDGPAAQETLVSIVVNCTGTGAMNIELLQGNSALQSWQDVTCGRPSQLILNLFVGAPYTLHLAVMQANPIQQYMSYTLIVSLK